MEDLVYRLEEVREKCRGYKNPRFFAHEGIDCPRIVEEGLMEDLNDNFPKGYKHPLHNYIAAFVRASIEIAENGRNILYIHNSGIDNNPETIKLPFMLSRPSGAQDKSLINARFNTYNVRDQLLSKLKTLLKSNERDYIISDFNKKLLKYGYSNPELDENEFINMYVYIYKETAWAASIADFYAEDLKNVILSNPSHPQYYMFEIPKELPWLPRTKEEAAVFNLNKNDEVKLRNFLISRDIKENDLIFFPIPQSEDVMITYFMDNELGNNFRGYSKSLYFPASFYQFLGIMGLTRRIAESLYGLGHVIQPEPGYWPPRILKKKII